MSSVFFGNASRIIKQVFDWLQTSGQTKTSNLIVDSFTSGINNATDAGEGFSLVPGTSPLSVTVQGQGIAYDPIGARIFLAVSDVTSYNPSNVTETTNDGLGNFISTPQSSGCVNIPLTGGSFNYLWIDYLATTDTSAFTLNAITEAKIFYKLTDGYNIQVTTTNIAPDANSIFLGTINLTSISSGIVPSSVISQTGRSYYNILPNVVPITTPQANRTDATTIYNPASSYTLEAHIKAVGTSPTGVSPTNPHAMTLTDLGISSLDTVVGHRQLEHGIGGGTAAANAIIAGVPGTPSPSTSAMAAQINIVNPGSDYLTIFQLLASEFALINGTAYNVTDIFGAIPVNANVFFPTVSGTYNVYYDSVVKTFSLTTSDISSDASKLWLCTITYTYVGSGPSDHNALSALIDRRRIGSSTHLLQRWLTSARPGSGVTSASAGEFGFNLTSGLLEYWDGSAWQQPVNSSTNVPVPTGAMLDFAGSSAPTGFLLCDGTAISRTTFSNLFATISTIWGVGDGSTTFNLPDFQRRTAVGSGGSGTGTLGSTVGNTGGEETHTLTTTEIPSHNHPVNDSGHNHRSNILGFVGDPQFSGHNQATNGGTTVFESPADGVATNTTGITVGNTGGGGAHNNIQPSAIVTKIIKY